MLELPVDIKLLFKMGAILNVYRVFEKSREPGAMKRMSKGERKLMLHVMALDVKDKDGA